MELVKPDNCPQPALLIEFFQGKLEPPVLDDCEAHLEHCAQCHETLRSLDTRDTLSEKVAAALIADQPRDDSDSMQIDGLIKRLTSDEFQRRSPAVVQTANSEIMADRAAEVLRCVEPDEQTLGVLGDYALLRLIGSGSTGVVFQALDRKLERTVALKVLRPSLGVFARERFLAEARSAASIDHANVVTIFQVGQVDRLAFIAMQWSPGQTLETKLQSGASFDESQVTDIILKVATGLAAAHQRQMVHRDIKPANLWVCDSDNQIKILDFGLARISDDNPGLTATGMLAGTPNFMSPEQARGLELDGRSDLFSLGCLMYQLLTGRLPFGAPTVLATLQSVQNQSPTPPHQIKPDVSQRLSDLTMCLLEKQPANRPESAQQLIGMLSSKREDWPIAVNQYAGSAEINMEVTRTTVSQEQQRSGGMGWLMAGLFLGLAGWGAWLWSPQIIRVMTDQGEVVIESKADDVEVQVFADGKLIRVVDAQTQQSFDLKSGKYTFAAQSSGNGENTFSISPNQLTMSRGSTQIVKVTAPEVRESLPKVNRSKKSKSQPPIRPNEKPVFKNQTFWQWKRIAQRDRNAVTRTEALKACAATAETDSEVESLIELTRKLSRKYGSCSIGDDKKQDLYYEGMLEVLNTLDVDQIASFIETEIAEGTEASRRFCFGWLVTLNDGFIQNDWISKRNSVREKVDQQLGDVLASHLEKPGNALILKGLQYGFDKKKFKKTALAKALKQSAADPDQRLLLYESIIRLLGDDLEMFQLFGDDILNPKTDAETRHKFFYSMRFIHYQNWPLAHQWAQLLFDVADGALRPGDQRLEFVRNSEYGRQRAEHVLTNVLLSLSWLEPQLEARSRTDMLLPKLQKLKKAVEKAVNDPDMAEDFIPARTKILLGDFDYMIEKISGDSDAEMPENGFLKKGLYPWSSTDGRVGGGDSGGGGVF